MRILYVAPRYHTNQMPIIKGWLDNGHEVLFISQYTGQSEDTSLLTPTVLGYSPVFNLINSIYCKINRKKLEKSADVEAFAMKIGFPPIFKMRKLMKKFNADAIIIRDRNVYSIFAYLLSGSKKKCILYNQNPLFDTEPQKNDIAHRVVRALTPKVRITPVYGNPSNPFKDEKGVYAPFVMNPVCTWDEGSRFAEGKINLLCVSKYEKRKNIDMIFHALETLANKYSINLTIAGQVTTPHHEEYYKLTKELANKCNQNVNVKLLSNLSRKDIDELYKTHDVFLLPSTGEFASISQLEAMACSLPVICSDANGTSNCVHNGINGYLFTDKSYEDFYNKLDTLLSNKNQIKNMGESSYNIIRQEYQFSNYENAINTALSLY